MRDIVIVFTILIGGFILQELISPYIDKYIVTFTGMRPVVHATISILFVAPAFVYAKRSKL